MQWSVGDPCRCVFGEDSEVYEATVTELLNRTATVVFVGYNNQDTIPINKLYKWVNISSMIVDQNVG